jgi:hypothetical protein
MHTNEANVIASSVGRLLPSSLDRVGPDGVEHATLQSLIVELLHKNQKLRFDLRAAEARLQDASWDLVIGEGLP